jgi:hypothetical protein
MFNPKLSRAVQSYEVSAEAVVRAPRMRAWEALTVETDRWWPRHFFNHPKPVGFVVEGAIGGRVFEDWGDGAGYLFGTVVVWAPGERMTWACELYPDWSGPGRSYVTFVLEDAGPHTLVRVTDAGYCTRAAQAADGLGKGWGELIRHHFKRYVEGAG